MLKEKATNFVLIFVLVFCKENFAQNIDGVYYRANQKLQIISKSNDTIKAIFDEASLLALKIDTSMNAKWFVYSNKDTLTLLYRVEYNNGKKEGIEELNFGDYLLTYSFINDVLNGPFTKKSPSGVFYFFRNYKDGVLYGPGFIYNNGRLEVIEYFNKSGKVYKRKIIR